MFAAFLKKTINGYNVGKIYISRHVEYICILYVDHSSRKYGQILHCSQFGQYLRNIGHGVFTGRSVCTRYVNCILNAFQYVKKIRNKTKMMKTYFVPPENCPFTEQQKMSFFSRNFVFRHRIFGCTPDFLF